MPNVNVVSQLVVNVVIPIIEILYTYIYTFFRPNIDNRHAFQQYTFSHCEPAPSQLKRGMGQFISSAAFKLRQSFRTSTDFIRIGSRLFIFDRRQWILAGAFNFSMDIQ